MSSKPAFDHAEAFELLKARLDRGGLPITSAQERQWQAALEGTIARLEQRHGIHPVGTADDYQLVVDMTAFKILNRDNPGGYPETLREDLRNRYMQEGMDE